MSNDDRQAVVTGTVMWQSLDKPNDLSGKYQIDICKLSKDDVKALEGIGLTVKDGGKDKPEHGKYVTPKANRQVMMVDAEKNEWDVAQLLGNGSLAKVAVRAYDYDFKGKKGVAAGLQAVQVLEHVGYDPAGAFKKEEKYVTKATDDDNPPF